MTSPPDKLFRDGLEYHRKDAPASAWERIESGLDRKRDRSPWMKIAAGFVLMLATSVMFFQLNQNDGSITTVSKETTAITLNPDSAINAVTELQEIGDRRQEAVSSGQSSVESSKLNSIVERSRNEPGRKSLQSPASSQQSAVNSLQSSTSTEDTVAPDESGMVAATDPVEKSVEHKPVTQEEITSVKSVNDAVSDSKRTNLTYTAEEVNAKYLKKELNAQATPEKKNASGLQKVVDLALDFKNEGSVLGELREKKNELLSFNIPSNKRETNK